MAFINAKNKVPQHQATYQAAFRGHTRIWKIAPRSNVMITPFLILMYGGAACSMYAMGRKVLGYNTWFSKE